MVTTTSLGVTCSARQPGPDRCLQPNVARRTTDGKKNKQLLRGPFQGLRIPIVRAVQEHAMHASQPPLSYSRARAKGPRARVSRARVYPPPPHSSGAEKKTPRSESRKLHPIYFIGALLVDVLETSAISGVFCRLDDAGLGAGAQCRPRHGSRCTCLLRGRGSRRMAVNLRVHLVWGFAQWPHACRVLAG